MVKKCYKPKNPKHNIVTVNQVVIRLLNCNSSTSLALVKDNVLGINHAHKVQFTDLTFTVNTQTDKKNTTSLKTSFCCVTRRQFDCLCTTCITLHI